MAFCTKCGQMIPDGASFCTKCGTKVQSFSTEPTPAWTPSTQPYYGGAVPSKSNKALFVIIGSAVLVVAIVLVLVFTLGGGGLNLSSPEASVNSFLSAVSRNDLKGMVKCTNYGAMITDQAMDALINSQVMSNYNSTMEASMEGLQSFLYTACDDYSSSDLDLSKGVNSIRATNLRSSYGSNSTKCTVSGTIEIISKTGENQSYKMQVSLNKNTDGKWYIQMS